MARQKKEAPVVPPVEEKAKEAREELYNLTRRVLLAGVGAAALAYDEATAFVDRLVERGELARGEARDLLDEFAARRKERMGPVRSRIRGNIAQAMEKLDVPRRSDMEALQQRIDALNARVEALLKEKEGQG